ncbi:uncharacterized protein LOC116338004 [Contarinia nasturtii]|uniref:uncharacterized protein LOC116338004 n=1 Tax=Contarinia nasturtii TaxID=265458 RepID=UPI0012D38FBB|nr:uncharacterized protein LOC116338004 [Contarinia nasturtii]XP_031618883.1 uncharacterized protein LOC116338004 [Contarinia nasturtii]XP_031618884.1 uncharacterized protein LOC116338004 [Contarinia nasturtii]
MTSKGEDSNTTTTTDDNISLNEDPVDLQTAKLIINKFKQKCRMQSEQILNWKKAYNMQRQQHFAIGQLKTEQLNALTSQLYLLESRLRRKQRHIANILIETECTIVRQQKIIDTLSSRLVDYKLDSCSDFEKLNDDGDSAVVLDDIIDCDSTNSSIALRRRHNGGDIIRSVSDAIDSTLNKYLPGNLNRRSNCYLRRPDILETVYSVEEDAEAENASEKRENFKRQSKHSSYNKSTHELENIDCETVSISISEPATVTYPRNVDKTKNVAYNYNRIMSNHRTVTKPKDVKYKRINKAKSKSLEELRGRLKHWIDRGNSESLDAPKPAPNYVV